MNMSSEPAERRYASSTVGTTRVETAHPAAGESKSAPTPLASRLALMPCVGRLPCVVYVHALRARLNRAAVSGRRFPRPPDARVWPVMREVLAVIGATVGLIAFLPAAFHQLPRPFHVTSDDPPVVQLGAALAGATIFAVIFFANFTAYGLLFVYRYTVLVHMLVSSWIFVTLGIPLGLLLLRLFEAAGAPLDWPTLIFATFNLTVPGVLLAQWSPTKHRFAFARRLHAAALASLCAWVLASVPPYTLIAMLGLFAILDILLVALPCCSPVQQLDRITWQRVRKKEPQIPGLTFYAAGDDGLLLGLGDFIVFAVFTAHAAAGGIGTMAAVACGVLFGLVVTMYYVALKWPQRALEPAIPLSVVFGAVLLALEWYALKPLVHTLAESHIWT